MRTIAAAGAQDHTRELFNRFLLDEGDSAGLRDAVKEIRKDPMSVVLFRPAKLSVKPRSFLSFYRSERTRREPDRGSLKRLLSRLRLI